MTEEVFAYLLAMVGTCAGIGTISLGRDYKEISLTMIGVFVLIVSIACAFIVYSGYDVNILSISVTFLLGGIIFLIWTVHEESESEGYIGIVYSLIMIVGSSLFLLSLVAGPYTWLILATFGLLLIIGLKMYRTKAEEDGERSLIFKFEDRSKVDSREARFGFEKVGDLEIVKETINEMIVGPLKNPLLAKKYGKSLSGGVLLYGPPGCGKSLLGEAISRECGASFFHIRISDILSMWYGKSEKNLKNVFSKAKKESPSIVLIDEVDSLGIQRSIGQDDATRRVLSQLLMEMDMIQGDSKVFIIGTTNMPWDVDSALLRPGRFDVKLLVPPPDKKAREKIFNIHLMNLTANGMIDDDVNISKLADMTNGFSGADIMEVCRKAATIPWKEAFHGKGSRKVNMKDFTSAIKEQKPTIKRWISLAASRGCLESHDEFSESLKEIIAKYQEEEDVGRYA